jgi:hypothetical protein
MPFANPEQKREYDKSYYRSHHYSVLAETPDYLHIKHPDGSTFKLAKAGLSPKILSGVKLMCEGGAVQEFEVGGKVASMLNDPLPADTTDQSVQPADPGLPPDTSTQSVLPGPYPANPVTTQPPYGDALALAVTKNPQQLSALGKAARSPLLSVLPIAQLAADAITGSGEPAATSTDKPDVLDASAPAAPTSHSEDYRLPPFPKFGGIGGGMPGTLPGEAEAIEGIKQKGAAVAAADKTRAELEQARAAGLQKISDDTQKWLSDRMVNADKMFNDVKDAKLDPDHYFATRSTGEKIMSSISVLLGGLGAGLTHGPNVGMQMIEKDIDRDIEAQKFNLGKQQNLLSTYMAQTHDLLSAKQLVKADFLDISAAQLESAAAQSGSDVAMAEAKIESGKWRSSAYSLRADIGYKNAHLASMNMDMQLKQWGMQQQQQNMIIMQKMLGGVMGGGQATATSGHTGGLNGGMPVSPYLLERMGMLDKSVKLDDGTYAIARTADSAKQMDDLLKETRNFQTNLNGYRALLESHTGGPAGSSGGAGIFNPGSKEWGQAKVWEAALLGSLNKIGKLQRLTDVEIENIYKPMVPDIKGPTMLERARGQLDGLQAQVDSRNRSEAQSTFVTNLPGI